MNYYGRDDVKKDPLDIVKARALLEEEGYTAENPLEWTYTAFNLQYHKSVALLLKEQWEKLDNVKVENQAGGYSHRFQRVEGGQV